MCEKPDNSRQAGAGENIADMISEDVLGRVAHDLSLGLDCNVPLMACKEAVGLLFSEMRKESWLIQPPAP